MLPTVTYTPQCYLQSPTHNNVAYTPQCYLHTTMLPTHTNTLTSMSPTHQGGKLLLSGQIKPLIQILLGIRLAVCPHGQIY